MYASILVALSLVLSPAPGVCRAAPPTKPEARPEPAGPGKPPEFPPLPAKLESRAAIVVDTSAAGEEGEVVRQRIRSKAEAEMQALALLIGDAPTLPQVVTKISALGGDAIGWSYTIDINHASQSPIPGGSFVGECQDCTENELVDRVAGDVRSLLPRLRAYIVDHNAQVDAEAKRRDEALKRWEDDQRAGQQKGGAAEPVSNADVMPMHPLCKAGIGLMAGGVVGAGVGIGLVVNPDRFGTGASCGDPGADLLACSEGRSTHIPGYVALGVGGAVLAAGIALFVVGHRKSKAPQTALVPSFGAGVVGLQWSGRF